MGRGDFSAPHPFPHTLQGQLQKEDIGSEGKALLLGAGNLVLGSTVEQGKLNPSTQLMDQGDPTPSGLK